MVDPQNFNCPMCGQVDRVEKVSAIVGAGTSSGLYGGHTSSIGLMAGVSQTALSQKLSPPSRPVYDSPWGTGTKVSIGILIVMAGMDIIFTATANPPESASQLLSSLFFLLLFLVPLILIISSKSRTAQRRKAQYDAAIPIYTAAYKKWNELYYCGRNDVVFILGQARTCVPASEMSQLLYKP